MLPLVMPVCVGEGADVGLEIVADVSTGVVVLSDVPALLPSLPPRC